jgi:hypothetical protein
MAVASPRRATLAELARNGSPRLRRPGNFLIREGRARCDCGVGRGDALGGRILDRQQADVKPQFVTYDGAAAREGGERCYCGGDVQRVSGNGTSPRRVSITNPQEDKAEMRAGLHSGK